MHARILLSSALLLSACSGGSAPPALDGSISAKANGLNAEMNRRCTSLQAGSAVFTPGGSCPQCSSQDAAKSIDGSDESYAYLHEPYAPTGSMALRSTAAPGVVFPAGANAAVTLSAVAEQVNAGGVSVKSTSDQSWRLTISTYLGGVLQEQDVGDIRVSTDPDTRHVSGITTTLPFDAIEAQFERPISYVDDPGNITVIGNDPTKGGNVNVHEFCGGFDLTGLNVSEN